MNKQRSGAFYILMAATFWSFGGVLGKLIVWNGFTIAALRGLIAAVVIGLYRRSFKVQINRSIILAAACLSLTTLLFMLSNKLTTSANAIVLQYTAPIYIILLSWVFLKQKPQARDIFALVGVGTGILLFFFDQFSTGAWLGDLLGLLSGLTFAGVFFANKLPKASPVDASYLGNIMSLIYLPLILFDANFLSFDLNSWIFIFLMGVFQLGLGYILFSLGIQRTSASSAGILAGLEPILNPIWVFLIIQERPNLLAIIGGALVLITVFSYHTLLSKPSST